MNKSLGVQLLIFGPLLAGLSWLAHRHAPTTGLPTLVAGLAGGLSCVGCALWALGGHRGKAPAVLTLAPVTFVLLSQAVVGWIAVVTKGEASWLAPGIVTVAFLLTLTMLMRVACTGVDFGAEASRPKGGASGSPSSPGKVAAVGSAGRRA